MLHVCGCFVSRPTFGGQGVRPASLTPEAWISLGAPTEGHSLLAPLEGEWDVEVATRGSPAAPVSKSPGRSRSFWILGGRFLQEEFTGGEGAEHYSGIGIMGYDNSSAQFSSLWIDSLTTAMALSRGRYYLDTKRFELEGEVYDPLRGGLKRTRTTLEVKSKDRYLIKMFETLPNGREFPALEISYRRTSP